MKYLKAFICTTITATALAQAQQRAATLTTYYDSRGLANANIQASTRLPGKMAVLAWTDLFDASHKQRAYAEAYLTKEINRGLAVCAELDVAVSDDAAGTTRAGAQYRIPRTPLTFRYSPFSSGKGQQLTVFGGKRLREGLTASGFFDYDVRTGKAVTEWEVAKRLKGRATAVIEARYNGYERRRAGIAAGIRYRWP